MTNINFDLCARTSKFGESSIKFIQSILRNDVNKPIISQFIRSATSIGANYMEADCAESKNDFIHKMGICKKEAKETTHWLYMLAISNPEQKDKCRELWQEAHELTLIFSSIINKTKSINS